MPHVVIEYAAGIETMHDLQILCGRVFDALAARDEIPDATTLKVRALPCPHWRNGTEPQSFAHATLSLLPGREVASKQALARCILTVMETEMPDIGSLSVDVTELSTAYTKRVLKE